MDTRKFLDEIIRRNGLASDYALSLHMREKYGRWSIASISNYRNVKQYPNDRAAIDIAKELGLNVGYVMACIHAERAREKMVKKAWLSIAKTFQQSLATLTAVILSASLLVGFPSQSKALEPVFEFNPLTIMRTCGWRLIRQLSHWFKCRFLSILPAVLA